MYLQKVKSKKLLTKSFFVDVLKAADEKSRIRIRTKMTKDPQHYC
jgi:hypothetical protein